MVGLIQIYCGEGKVKTSAAIGQAVRSAGAGLSVVFVRFLKTEGSGELKSLACIPGITMVPCCRSFGFYWNMTDEQKDIFIKEYGSIKREAVCGDGKTGSQNGSGSIISDERCVCIHVIF